MRRRLEHRARSRTGQTVTEYLLVITVFVIAIAAVVYDPIAAAFLDGTDGFYKTAVQGAETGGYDVTNGQR